MLSPACILLEEHRPGDANSTESGSGWDRARVVLQSPISVLLGEQILQRDGGAAPTSPHSEAKGGVWSGKS